MKNIKTLYQGKSLFNEDESAIFKVLWCNRVALPLVWRDERVLVVIDDIVLFTAVGNVSGVCDTVVGGDGVGKGVGSAVDVVGNVPGLPLVDVGGGDVGFGVGWGVGAGVGGGVGFGVGDGVKNGTGDGVVNIFGCGVGCGVTGWLPKNQKNSNSNKINNINYVGTPNTLA